MSGVRLYTIRPFSKSQRADLKDAFRVYLSPGTLLLNKLRSGDTCYLETETTSIPVQVWSAHEKIQDNIVQTSKYLQDLHGLKLGDKVSIRRDEAPLVEVQVALLSEIQNSENGAISTEDLKHWEWFLKFPLRRAEFFCPGMVLASIEIHEDEQKRSFKVEQINSTAVPNTLYRFVSHSQVRLKGAQDDIKLSSSLGASNLSLQITKEGIGGLVRQIEDVNQCLAEYDDGGNVLKPVAYKDLCRGGILLYGPHGTGKSMILRKIAKSRWRKVLHLNASTLAQYGGNTDAAIRKIFDNALQYQPSVIILDCFEKLACGRDSFEGVITSSLCEGFDRIDGTRVLFAAATTKLNAINEMLRQDGYFDFEIEVPIPDPKARAEILKILSHLPQHASEELLDIVAERTHSYSGADLRKLVRRAILKAENRELAALGLSKEGSQWTTSSESRQNSPHEQAIDIVYEVKDVDYQNAQMEIRPTTMQTIHLEIPKVHWSDIGGQSEIKQSLIRAIEWPFTRAHQMQMLGLKAKNSLLLYGPPGCSKTLTARAVATEFSLNFISVKGPELLNMYVGESERMVREVFQKARAARPSIIFFDEIDAIGASRDAQGNGSQSGVHTLSTLLNEMDGMEELQGVFVLAATNKPDLLDPALIRPGRFTDMLYVGVPDFETRLQILRIHLRKMPVAKDVDVDWLAKETEGFSGAEIAKLCQEAGYATMLGAEMDQQLSVGMKHFEVARAQVQPSITAEMKKYFEDFSKRRA